MTVWMLHLPLSSADEESIRQRAFLPLPFGNVPDLTLIGSSFEFRRMMASLNMELPPEALDRMQDKIWKILSELQPEDIIAVPLTHKRAVALAEVSGKYTYSKDAGDNNAHQIPVTWQEKLIPLGKFRLHKPLIENTGNAILEVSDPSARAIIQSSLKRSYNRFAGLKWIVLVFTLWHLFQMLMSWNQ